MSAESGFARSMISFILELNFDEEASLYFFLYGMKFAVEELGEVWGARLMGFGLSYLIFPLLLSKEKIKSRIPLFFYNC